MTQRDSHGGDGRHADGASAAGHGRADDGMAGATIEAETAPRDAAGTEIGRAHV